MNYMDVSGKELITESGKEYKQVLLPVNAKLLDPVLSKENVDHHYRTLHRNYVAKANAGSTDHFIMGGVELHNLYFEQLTLPHNNKPNDRILFLIEDRFGSYTDFKTLFKAEALSIQGSGWCYLSKAGEIKTIKNHAPRSNVAIIIDMWEHAYYLDYGPDKTKYIDNSWKIINWDIVNGRLS
jgi:Fe-Mn family superoxide dismutase